MSVSRGEAPNRRLRVSWIAAAFAGTLLLAPATYAQVSSGTILGNVKDTSGAAVPGAQVTATNMGTQFSRTTTTDAEGQYALRLLPVGDYKVEVDAERLQELLADRHRPRGGPQRPRRRDDRARRRLRIVSVVADAPLVETNSASLSRTVGQNEVLNLPLVNRDLYSLLSLTGGVTSNDSSNSLGGPEQTHDDQRLAAAPRSAPSTSSSTAATTPPACAAPATRRRIRRRSRSSASSRTTTPRSTAAIPAGIVDVVTKSGTNQFHGAVFEFFRNEKLNSKRWAPPGVDRREGSARPEPVRRRRRRAASGRTRRSSSSATPALRQEETYYRNTAVVPTAARAGRRLLPVGPQAQGPGDEAQPFPGNIDSRGTLRPGGAGDPGANSFRRSNLPNNFFEVRPARPPQHRRGDPQAGSQPLPDPRPSR